MILKAKFLFNYLFNREEKLPRKSFTIHFFLDTFIILFGSLLILWPLFFLILFFTKMTIAEQDNYLGVELIIGFFVGVLLIANKISVIIRRLNDLELSSWYSLLFFVLPINIFFHLFLFFKVGKRNP